ncbi:MAG: NYN domain-containing protein [Persephonella sp.]|nr:MAG: NYN domain-containing protein [Persephonella sp.]
MFGFFKSKEEKKVQPVKIVKVPYKQERIAIFIDAGNMFFGSNYLKVKIDYKKLINLLKRDRWLLRGYFYTGIPTADLNLPAEYREQWKKQKNFLNELQNIGIKVKTMPLKKTPEGFIEKGIDILLATDMIVLAYNNAYDTAILVSGDSDYIPVVEMIQQLGKRVENASFKRTSSYELRKVCDDFILLDNYLDKFTEPLNKPKTEPKKEKIQEKKESSLLDKLKKIIFSKFNRKEENNNLDKKTFNKQQKEKNRI